MYADNSCTSLLRVNVLGFTLSSLAKWKPFFVMELCGVCVSVCSCVQRHLPVHQHWLRVWREESSVWGRRRPQSSQCLWTQQTGRGERDTQTLSRCMSASSLLLPRPSPSILPACSSLLARLSVPKMRWSCGSLFCLGRWSPWSRVPSPACGSVSRTPRRVALWTTATRGSPRTPGTWPPSAGSCASGRDRWAATPQTRRRTWLSGVLPPI